MTMHNYTDPSEPMGAKESQDALHAEGPLAATRLVQDAVTAAMHLIQSHAFAAETMGMTKTAKDLFLALEHLRPVGDIVSAAQGMALDEQLKMQRQHCAGLIAVGFSQSSDPDTAAMAKRIAKELEDAPYPFYGDAGRTTKTQPQEAV